MYASIGLLAIVLHLIINRGYFSNKENNNEVSKAYKRYSLAALLYYVSDSLWGVLHDLKIPMLLYVDTLLYYIAMALTVVLLCRYVTYYLNLDKGWGKFIRFFGYAFGLFEAVLLIINHFVHIFFWINSDGSYQAYIMRYVALYIHVILCVLLAILTGTVIGKAKGEKKEKYVSVFLFCIEMTIALIVQILYPLLPMYSIGLVIGICIINTYVKKNEIEEQYKVLLSMADIHYSMHVIDLVNDTVQEFNAKNEVKAVVNQNKGAAKMMSQIMQLIAEDEYLEKTMKFTDLTTLADRMKGQKSISTQFVGKKNGWILAMFIATETDSEDRPIKVVFTTRIIDKEKKQEQQLIIRSQIDELTGLYNRREYEDDILKYPDIPVESDFVYAAIDVNGLKVVNDEIGHAAGDELIKGAAECLRKSIGNYGKVYRTGGDEFAAMFFADEENLAKIIADLEEKQLAWEGDLVSSLSLSVGYVTKRDFGSETVINMAKIADERMYKAKSEYYAKKGVDRRGQAAAHKALCNLYTKILKINLTTDTYSIVNMDLSEQTTEKGFADSISGWLHGFGKSGQVHQDDLDEYLRKTDIVFMKEYFTGGKTSLSVFYRRKYADEFKQVAMEMIPADDYSVDNQTLFLYVKNIDI